MSTPFPLEEASQTDNMRPVWNPWGSPATPHWYSGMGFDDESHYLGPLGRALDAAGSGAAKGEAMLGGALAAQSYDPNAQAAGEEPVTENPLAQSIEADAKQRVSAMTPNPATTGAAVQLLHGVVSGGTEMAIGGLAGGLPGAAAFAGGSEGRQRYNELIDAGVDHETAEKSAFLAGGAAAAGAVLPVGFGSGLLTKVATGATSQAAFGVSARYADHQILDSAGYHEMAAQQKVIDGTQIITDLILGAAFGGLAHLHDTPQVQAMRDAPGARDAALTTNLAIRDREAAPGVPTDPHAANAHQEALEKSIADLIQGKSVDVSDAKVEEAAFLKHPEDRNPDTTQAVKDAIGEGDPFGEDNERDVNAILEGRKPESVQSEPHHVEEGYTVGEQELTDEQIAAFKGIRPDVQGDEVLPGSREGVSGQPGHPDDGGSGAQTHEPLTVYRGSDRELVPEHFELNALGHATGHPSSGLGVFFSKDRAEASRYGKVSEHNLDIRNPKLIKAEDLPAFDSTHEANAYREKLRAQGYDGMTIDASHLGGPVNYVAFDPKQVYARDLKKAEAIKEARAKTRPQDPTEQALADNPNLTIPDENGNLVSAREALDQANEDLAREKSDSTKAVKAAITCHMRRGN